MLLEGKVVAVIGGNGWIGREAVNAIVSHGGAVVTASRSGKMMPSLQEKFSEKT